MPLGQLQDKNRAIREKSIPHKKGRIALAREGKRQTRGTLHKSGAPLTEKCKKRDCLQKEGAQKKEREFLGSSLLESKVGEQVVGNKNGDMLQKEEEIRR
jgi:hypothetical protein